VSQGGSRLERTIIPRVIESRQLDGILRALMDQEIVSRLVVAVAEEKGAVVARFDRELPDAAQTRRDPVSERALLRESAHFKARAIR
jgi:hypothetical protein